MGAQPAPGTWLPRPAVPRDPYPEYILFAPGQETPTAGAEALTGAVLPGGVVGLIVRLNDDSARIWRGGGGTANISIPVATVFTFRFGMYPGRRLNEDARRPRPRVEFPLHMRFVSSEGTIRVPEADIGIMLYGYSGDDSGHKDIRMNVSTTATKALGRALNERGLGVPRTGDVALLEWPTVQDPSVRLTYLERGSALHDGCMAALTAADVANQAVGKGACWLPPGVSPPW